MRSQKCSLFTGKWLYPEPNKLSAKGFRCSVKLDLAVIELKRNSLLSCSNVHGKPVNTPNEWINSNLCMILQSDFPKLVFFKLGFQGCPWLPKSSSAAHWKVWWAVTARDCGITSHTTSIAVWLDQRDIPVSTWLAAYLHWFEPENL